METQVRLGPLTKVIRLTVTNRAQMRFPIILGRQALAGDFIVDVSRKYLLRKKKWRPLNRTGGGTCASPSCRGEPDLYSTRALVEAGEKRGHDVRVLDTLQFDLLHPPPQAGTALPGRAGRPGRRGHPADRRVDHLLTAWPSSGSSR